MRASGCIVRDRQAGAEIGFSRRSKSHVDGTGSPGLQWIGTGILLMEITTVGATQPDALDGQGSVATILQRDGLRRTGGIDLVVPEAQNRWTQAYYWCGLVYTRPAQCYRLWAAGCIVRDRQAGAATAFSRRGKGHADGTGSPGLQWTGTGILLMEITTVGATQPDALDGQGSVATILQRDGLRRTGGIDLVVPEAQNRWTQAHYWCRRGCFS